MRRTKILEHNPCVEIESRLCKNCEYFKDGYCYNKDICNWHSIKENEGVYVEYTYFLNNFSCNRFKRK